LTTAVAFALAQAKALGLDRLDAHLLLAHHLGCDRAWLLAHGDSVLPPSVLSAFEADCQRRADAVPMAYLLGQREFHGLMLKLSPDVLVPRPDTEILVDWALHILVGDMAVVSTPEVLDLGTGSGAIALALKHSLPRARLSASDASAAALEVARGNARAHRLEVEFRAGDWWLPWGERRFDLVVSNPPYIAADDAHLTALRHEPAVALSPGADGLAAINRIIDEAATHLREGAWLLIEHGNDQAHRVRQRLREAGFTAVQTRADLSGHDRCSAGHRARPD
jgi:release factor glutamine methyltransferase